MSANEVNDEWAQREREATKADARCAGYGERYKNEHHVIWGRDDPADPVHNLHMEQLGRPQPDEDEGQGN